MESQESKDIERLEKLLDAALVRIEMLERQVDRLECWKDNMPTGSNP